MTSTAADMLIAKMFAQGPQQQPVIPQGSHTGQPLQGPGTGVSDSIPATVQDENNPSETTPAALSKNEFVVKSDVIMKLGQGNPELGSQILQGVIDQLMAKSEPKVKKNQVSKGIGSLLGAK